MISLPIDYLNDCLIYNPDTGEIKWKSRPESHFSATERVSKTWQMNRWNSRHAGKIAGTISPSGYREIKVNLTLYKAHRIAWSMHYGSWPEDHIDHIDGNRANNKINNLRVASHAVNQRNKRLGKNNSTGIFGVCWDPWKKWWRVQIGTDYLGCYKSLLDASSARKSAELELGYHVNHGR